MRKYGSSHGCHAIHGWRRASPRLRPGAKARYKWLARSDTTLGVLMASINASILLIALPDIFRGAGIYPLAPGNTSLLLWLIMGYMVATAVLVVSFGQLGDMYGRVEMYNAGFAIFRVFSILLTVTWTRGSQPCTGSSLCVFSSAWERPC